MCGVVGLFAPNSSKEWRKEVLDGLLYYAKSRGDDATGIAYVGEDGKMVIVKAGEEATKFVFQNEDYQKATENCLPPLVIGHTRAATCHYDGGPSNPINDHPFYAPGVGVAMVHNGIIRDDEIWRKTVGMPRGIKEKPVSQVDSEVALRIVETFLNDDKHPELANMEDAIEDMAYNLAGNYVLIFISEKNPNKIWFLRHDNPLTLAFLPKSNAIVFGSTSDIVENALTRNTHYLGFFRESSKPKIVKTDVEKDEMVSVELIEGTFKIERRKIECGTFDYKHHKEAFAKQLKEKNAEVVEEKVAVD